MTPYTRAIDAVSRELNPSSPRSPITRNKAEKVVRAVLRAIKNAPFSEPTTNKSVCIYLGVYKVRTTPHALPTHPSLRH